MIKITKTDLRRLSSEYIMKHEINWEKNVKELSLQKAMS